MTQPDPTCPKCNSPMELGYVPEYSHGGVLYGALEPRSSQIGLLFVLRSIPHCSSDRALYPDWHLSLSEVRIP